MTARRRRQVRSVVGGFCEWARSLLPRRSHGLNRLPRPLRVRVSACVPVRPSQHRQQSALRRLS